MEKLPAPLRGNVRLLGEVLGDTIRRHHGDGLFERIEEIRQLSKRLASHAAARESQAYQPLVDALGALPDADVLPVARAFHQFLDLANIADQEFFSGPAADEADGLAASLNALATEHGAESLARLLPDLRIELVLTAHPTEAMRRTLINKYDAVADTLGALRRDDLAPHEAAAARADLCRLVEEIWHTDEIRSQRPSAVDEAKSGFAVVENSLWRGAAAIVRHLDRLSAEHLGAPLPATCQPFRFYAWMGGDRDGNPNVTAEVTREVVLLGRWKMADLCLVDLRGLIEELSMHEASAELLASLAEPGRTPYRSVLHGLRARLLLTRNWCETCLRRGAQPEPEGLVRSREDVLAPLLLCQRSLLEQGMHHAARGPLCDLIRRVQAFGISLLPLDIRQDAERHEAFFDELCRHLELGAYKDWDEAARQNFLLRELQSRRPLLPVRWPASAEAAEVQRSCEVIAAQPREALSHYVISMARRPSDVLAVALLLKECGVGWSMPVAPLFETLDDLEQAPMVMQRLWSLPWYREYCDGRQTVMIGYSDSAKDAGKVASTWALYKCQEALVALARREGIDLMLFHGRGGSIGRGGGPVATAMAAQPPGSVQGRIRVTEQGEMIRYKFGLPRVAFNSLSHYLQATLRATLAPAPAPLPAWRKLMESMARESVQAYRGIVRDDPTFVEYFRALTPERELGGLAIGSRPARRRGGSGVESLRAIPWVFAWTQVRLNLPGWLGACRALESVQRQDADTLQQMSVRWPFFAAFLDLLEMLLDKADPAICAHYEAELVEPALQPLGQALRAELQSLIDRLNELKGQERLLRDNPLLRQSMAIRKPYIDPLNYLQVELLKRHRRGGALAPELELALKVTMTGIAAGMRNTG